MTAPARKAAPRKAPAKKAPSAAVAARREVRGEKGTKPVVLHVPFRGATFDVALDKLGNGRLYLRQKALEQFGGPEEICGMLFEILGKLDSARFINLMTEADDVFAAAADFFRALNKAGNDPN